MRVGCRSDLDTHARVAAGSIGLRVFSHSGGLSHRLRDWQRHRVMGHSLAPRLALGWCQLLAAAAIAWTAYSLAASLPYWPIDPSISSSIWFNFQLDLARAFWALLPPTLLWGASFPFGACGRYRNGEDGAKLFAGSLCRQHAGSHRRRTRREPAADRVGRIAARAAIADRSVDGCRSAASADASVQIDSRWAGVAACAVQRPADLQRPAHRESAHRVWPLRGHLGRQGRHRLRGAKA